LDIDHTDKHIHSATSFFLERPRPALAAPRSTLGIIGWTRRNLFANLFQGLATLLVLLGLGWLFWSLAKFLILDAVWYGNSRDACLSSAGVLPGACWAFIGDRLPYFIYGSYPIDERWRIDAFFLLGAMATAYALWINAPYKRVGLLYSFVIFPIISFFLLCGAPWIGVSHVPTDQWGGLMVTLVVAGVGIVVSLPVGIFLALGRRSTLPIVRYFSIMMIEVPRGVPLITVLFMANTMLPLFLPAGMNPDKLLRALIGIALFASAYMAEIIRGGLQAIPRGQYETALSLGFGYWRTMFLIIIPQALKIAIPNIVSINIGLFKDTSLLLIVGIFDFLSTIETARIDPKWAAPTVSASGYAFAAIVYFVFCWSMSLYGDYTERRLSQHRNK
jgi:general L-amino acid transport system permease protein